VRQTSDTPSELFYEGGQPEKYGESCFVVLFASPTTMQMKALSGQIDLDMRIKIGYIAAVNADPHQCGHILCFIIG